MQHLVGLESCGTQGQPVMIYFNTALQQQLLPQFHYVLRPGGALVLGESETVGRSWPTGISMSWRAPRSARSSLGVLVSDHTCAGRLYNRFCASMDNGRTDQAHNECAPPLRVVWQHDGGVAVSLYLTPDGRSIR
jgi:hypothetical protein